MEQHRDTATLAALFENIVSSYPTHEAVVDGDLRLNYRELDARSSRLAKVLQAHGVVKGARVVSLARDGLPVVELLIAATKLGAILCLLNWRLSVSELAYQIADLDPIVGVASPRFADLAAAATRTVPWLQRSEEEDWSMASSPSLTASPISDDPLLILYTSGTTGRPKGAVHSQGGLYIGALAYAGHRAVTAADRALISAPLFHVNGLSSVLIMLASGGCAVIAPQPLEMDELIRLLVDERCSVWNFHPMLTAPLLDRLRTEPAPIAIRSISMGASMHGADIAFAVRDVLGATISFGYGQTEIGGFGVTCTLDDQITHPNGWGRPLPHLRARIVDPSGNVLPAGAAGELCLRGAAVMQGYWRMPQATAEALGDGWLHTGDICRLDDEGMLHFAGRKKELIKSGGENIYPLEVEHVLRMHPAVADCCVVGVADSRWGEAVKAFVVSNGNAPPLPSELAAWCRREIAAYKRPRYVEFVTEIPRDFQRKPLRAQLAQRPVHPSQSTDWLDGEAHADTVSQ